MRSRTLLICIVALKVILHVGVLAIIALQTFAKWKQESQFQYKGNSRKLFFMLKDCVHQTPVESPGPQYTDPFNFLIMKQSS